MKILIVGGDDAVLSSLTRELEAHDCQVVPTHFGDGACRSLKKTARSHSCWLIIVTYRA